jgi:hypothetical protein
MAAFAVVTLVSGIVAQNSNSQKPTVDIFGSHEDESLQKHRPANGVIVSEKGWEKLAQAWGIKNPPKVDFSKEILIVATSVGSRLNVMPRLNDRGDLQVLTMGTLDIRPGFRYAIRSISREGIKTVNGKELPKE